MQVLKTNTKHILNMSNSPKDQSTKKQGKYGLRSNGAKKNIANIPRLTKKMRKFAHAYVQTESATQAGLMAYDTTSHENARQIAYDNLQKPHVQSYIAMLIEKHISDDEITALHVRNARQTENLPTSQKAIESLEMLKGLAVKSEQNSDVTVNIVNVFTDK